MLSCFTTIRLSQVYVGCFYSLLRQMQIVPQYQNLEMHLLLYSSSLLLWFKKKNEIEALMDIHVCWNTVMAKEGNNVNCDKFWHNWFCILYKSIQKKQLKLCQMTLKYLHNDWVPKSLIPTIIHFWKHVVTNVYIL